MNLQDVYRPWIMYIVMDTILHQLKCEGFNCCVSTIPAEWCLILSIASIVEVVHRVISKRYLP